MMVDGRKETKNETFRRLAPKRVEGIKEAMRKLTNLSNSYTYEYDSRDVEAIFVALQEELAESRNKFDKGLQKLEARKSNTPENIYKPRNREFVLPS